jgi:hypothetical protein
MLLFWRIRYLDTCDRKFKDRDLWLETDTLDPDARASVELLAGLEDRSRQREWLRYRRLFCESSLSADELNELAKKHGAVRSVFIHNYHEDENGQPLSWKRVSEIVTGDPDALLFPAGTPQHLIEYTPAKKRPVAIEQITLSADDLRILGYFARDLREMLSTAFYNDGPGRLYAIQGSPEELQTAVTDEEIRSFVTIFRRLYMENEPARFLSAVEVFASPMQEHPLGRWVAGEAAEYEQELQKVPTWVPFAGQEKFRFTQKRLIDVFLYTRYAHQPDRRRARQYEECLAALDGNKGLLAWLFLNTVWGLSLHVCNAGVIIADFFDRYRKVHGVACDVLASVAREHPGIGQLEKKADRERRLFQEAVGRFARQMWEDAGRPNGGPAQYEHEARTRLSASLGGQTRTI